MNATSSVLPTRPGRWTTRRQALATKELTRYGASPLLLDTKKSAGLKGDCKFPPNDEIMDKGGSSSSDDRASLLGVSIKNFRIVASPELTTIGNEKEMLILTSILNRSACNEKKLSPPEIVFINAFLSIEVMAKGGNSAEEQSGICSNDRFWRKILKIDATSALSEWASSHVDVPAKNEEEVASSLRGVEVLKIAHTSRWMSRKDRKQNVPVCSTGRAEMDAPGAKSSPLIPIRDEFNFDWTYSTPYSVPLFESTADTSSNELSYSMWSACDQSGIELAYLTDTSIPILFFDEIALYEDDLHDNGEVRLSVKIRIMPSCFYLLLRLFLRVDRVIVRCRDVRIFHRFDDEAMYRDVTWREARWQDLPSSSLPCDPASWMVENCQGLVNQLPLAALPSDIPKHSKAAISDFSMQ